MRRALLAILLIAGLGLVVASAWSSSDGRGTDRPAHARTGSAGRSGAAAADTGFADLSRATSSRCDLQADDIMRLPDTQRLQGSCCSPMQRDAYRRQVEYLSRYRHVAIIPRDPYDVSVRLAKRLLHERAIGLTTSQRVTYRQAMSLSREKGPCCCRCWRWEAFRGLSDHLIARERCPAARLAMLIQALDGCGGAWPGAHLDRRT